MFQTYFDNTKMIDEYENGEIGIEMKLEGCFLQIQEVMRKANTYMDNPHTSTRIHTLIYIYTPAQNAGMYNMLPNVLGPVNTFTLFLYTRHDLTIIHKSFNKLEYSVGIT